MCIGRAKRDIQPRTRILGRPETPAADLLRDLVAMYDVGRREPIPLPLKTSYAYAEARHWGKDPVYAANSRWKSGNYPGDDAHPPNARAFGSGASLKKLMSPLRLNEDGAGEANRLGAYAARLWLPMLRAEQRGR